MLTGWMKKEGVRWLFLLHFSDLSGLPPPSKENKELKCVHFYTRFYWQQRGSNHLCCLFVFTEGSDKPEVVTVSTAVAVTVDGKTAIAAGRKKLGTGFCFLLSQEWWYNGEGVILVRSYCCGIVLLRTQWGYFSFVQSICDIAKHQTVYFTANIHWVSRVGN